MNTNMNVNLIILKQRKAYETAPRIDVRRMAKDIITVLSAETRRISSHIMNDPFTGERLSVIDQKINVWFDDVTERAMTKILEDVKDKYCISDNDERGWVTDKWAAPMLVHYIKADPKLSDGVKEYLYHCVELAKCTAYPTERCARGIVCTAKFRCFLNGDDMKVVRVIEDPYKYTYREKEDEKPATKKKVAKKEEDQIEA